MKKMLRTTVVATAGVMVLILALTTVGARVAAQGMKPLLVQVINTAQEPVPVVSTVDRVLLQSQAGTPVGGCPNFAHEVRRVLPDGTTIPSFTVPPGKMLVLTDLQATVSEATGLPFTVGNVATVLAFHDSVLFTVISAQAAITADAVVAEFMPVSVHLQTGGVIGPNRPVCLAKRIDVPNGAYAADLQNATLHGYLIAE